MIFSMTGNLTDANRIMLAHNDMISIHMRLRPLRRNRILRRITTTASVMEVQA